MECGMWNVECEMWNVECEMWNVECEKCKHTGYRGRTGIHELMEVNDEIRDEILKRSPSHILRNLAVKNNMRTLQMDAIAKTFLGVTTVEEVLRVIYA